MSSVTCAADHVDAQQLVRLGMRDDLDEALGLAVDDGLAHRLEGHLADLDGDAVPLAFGLGAADGRDLRPGIGRARHLEVVDVLDLLARDGMHRGDALVRGHVGQPQAADDVADGVQVRLGRLHVARRP